MPEKTSNLGKLVSLHGIAPAFLQRAVIVAAVSFVFFFAMLVAFYLRQKLGYFLLSCGFLVIHILTLFGWLMLRRNVLRIYENGLEYRKFAARWSEIEAVRTSRKGGKIACEIEKKTGGKTVLTDAIEGIEEIVGRVEERVKKRAGASNPS